MPSNKNAVIRYMYLDQMLSDRYNKYTCEDLLKKVNERLELAGYPTIGGDKSDYDRWYLIGTPLATLEFPYSEDFYVNLPLDRMNGVAAVDGVDYIDCDEFFEDRYEDIAGITWLKEEEPTEILLAVKNTYTEYVDTKPLHGSQTKFPAGRQAELHDRYGAFEEYAFYTLALRPNRELYNTIYHNGDNIVLMSPSRIRENMIRELTSSLEKMKSVNSER